MYLMPLDCTRKIIKIGNVILCIFFHNKTNWEKKRKGLDQYIHNGKIRLSSWFWAAVRSGQGEMANSGPQLVLDNTGEYKGGIQGCSPQMYMQGKGIGSSAVSQQEPRNHLRPPKPVKNRYLPHNDSKITKMGRRQRERTIS
jgi:hypothetical protein